MESITLEGFIEERIKENEKLFTQEEIYCIRENRRCIHKVYLLGATNSRECFKEEKLF